MTAIPHERKGEMLVVLHIVDPERIPGVLAKLVSDGLPNLFIPRKENFVRIEKIPVLGTGKVDLKGLKAIAIEHFQSKTP